MTDRPRYIEWYDIAYDRQNIDEEMVRSTLIKALRRLEAAERVVQYVRETGSAVQNQWVIRLDGLATLLAAFDALAREK